MKRTRQGDPHGYGSGSIALYDTAPFYGAASASGDFLMAPPPSADSGMRHHFRIFIKQRKDKVMNDMEKCFYEPAELQVVDEGKGQSLVRAKGSPYKLGFLVAQGR